MWGEEETAGGQGSEAAGGVGGGRRTAALARETESGLTEAEVRLAYVEKRSNSGPFLIHSHANEDFSLLNWSKSTVPIGQNGATLIGW